MTTNTTTTVHNLGDLAEMCGNDTTEAEARLVRDALVERDLLEWRSDTYGGTLRAVTDDDFYAIVAAACAHQPQEAKAVDGKLAARADLFARAKHTYETARLGSTVGRKAEATMERLIALSERDGTLEQLLVILCPKAGA